MNNKYYDNTFNLYDIITRNTSFKSLKNLKQNDLKELGIIISL